MLTLKVMSSSLHGGQTMACYLRQDKGGRGLNYLPWLFSTHQDVPKTHKCTFLVACLSKFSGCIDSCLCFVFCYFCFFVIFYPHVGNLGVRALYCLHICLKITWLLVKANIKHHTVSTGPSLISILCWWFCPITFQSSKARMGFNRKLLLINIIHFIEIHHWVSEQTKLTKQPA